MSKLEQEVFEELKRVYRRHHAPVRTITIAVLVAYSDRWIRRVLRDMEHRGLVERRGQRGGWLPAMA